MKRSYVGVALLCAILMLNIIFTQYMVHQYFFENYKNTIIAAAVNVILFPVAIYIYKRDKKQDKGMKNHE
ncbi:MAG: hypothetical protein Q8906_04175 [Bacillota bacterium]|nr:hypothetical protein [Bacillota bacterium]MDP4169784.1 hypothetical protein [Bacillota bacterium]